MSDPHADTHAPAHHAAPDHHPHVLPVTVYLATFGALLTLTVITVAASRFDFGSANLVIAITIATIKATIVAAMFMHLAFDHKFHSLIIASSVLFLAIFIGFTMFDTEYRGRSDAVEADKPADVMAPFAASRTEAAIKLKYGWGEGGNKVAAAVASAHAMSAAMLAPPAASASAAPATAPAPSASAAPAASASR
ncbi:MAG: cytochrome C oxidase subunit IV family protein [Polyangiales bacterium]